MRYVMRAPSALLRSHVQGYWLVEDLAGTYRGPIRTVPHTHAVLAVHLGRPCLSDFEAGAPAVSLMGLQARAREWRAETGAYVVMAMLSLRGLARLFPYVGGEVSGELLELGGLLGDKVVRGLRTDMQAAPTPELAIDRLDSWLCARFAAATATADAAFEGAIAVLLQRGRVEAAVEAAGVSERQLERWFRRHVGWSPRSVLGLARVEASLNAVQTGRGDALAGFSDQAHQIRAWRRYLGTTPGRYRKEAEQITARMAEAAAREGGALSHFY
jgi:AraC-like DNA-binding protein